MEKHYVERSQHSDALASGGACPCEMDRARNGGRSFSAAALDHASTVRSGWSGRDDGIPHHPVHRLCARLVWRGADACSVTVFYDGRASAFLLFPNTADASIGTMMKSLKNDVGDWIDALIYACYGGGIVSTAIGVNNGIKKSKGDQQVTTGSIFGYGLGGPALGM